ncbi:MAG: hypothetical protein U9N85_01765 [Bacteroidota bacterium]|nr:hypothetical protein [Bacteroidota bacterium]
MGSIPVEATKAATLIAAFLLWDARLKRLTVPTLLYGKTEILPV